ncbi:protein FAM219A isoform X2 [Acinonyx jubatus]|uniref:Protein FAM219A isoform X2 n=1 Tax=Acinonyx jubatus TaxID=32536 RepID=A0ABM3NNF5_ACIJB|nr:protein FAM219A isoform X2 [Acinonyx jubatus]
MVASHQAVLCHLEFFPSFSVTKSYLLLFLIGGLKSGIFCLADDSIPEGILFFERSFPRGNQDPAAASISDGDCDAREGESVAMNYKPSPLQVKLEKQRELARKGSLKNGSMGSPVNQQPKKNNVMARTRLVVPNKGYSSLDQSPDEKPLVALDTDSDDDFDMSRYSSSGYSSAEINQDLNIQLLKDGYRLDEIPDDEDLDLIPPKSVNPTCMCCQATSSTACHIQ